MKEGSKYRKKEKKSDHFLRERKEGEKEECVLGAVVKNGYPYNQIGFCGIQD